MAIGTAGQVSAPRTLAGWLPLLVAAVVIGSCDRAESTRSDPETGWGGYNKALDGGRYVAANQIDTTNVTRLRPICELKLGEEGPFHAGPVVIGNTLFITTSHTTVAMSATDCVVQWRHVDTTGIQDPIVVNRGVAYMDGKVFRGMPGTRLAAFDAASGKVLWTKKIGDISVAEFVSSAPIAWDGLVFVGLAGSDWGIRGRMMAYDAETGEEKWRFNTIPMGSERGAETWHIPETAKRGGGGQWTTYTLDTQTGELFVPVANPAPDFTPDARPGDNLFTNSVVVLDAKTGALKWWYQATPRDGFDYDMGAAPILYRASDGRARVAAGSKDGYVHVVNRDDHSLAFKVPITTIKYAPKPTPEGVHACPGPLGGVEWNGPALDPRTNVIYVGSVDWCATFTSDEPEYIAGQTYMGTAYEGDPTEESKGWVTAFDGNTGRILWKYNTPLPVVAGVTPTAGGLLFTGDLGGMFYAFNKNTGQLLHRINVGGAIAGGVISYVVDNKQYVATTSGNISRSTFQTAGSPRLVIMSVDAPMGMMISLPEIAASAGQNPQQLFVQYCSSCHGTNGEGGGNGPALPGARRDVNAIAEFIKNPNPPMPRFFPSPLDEATVQSMAEYVLTLQGQ